MAHSRRKTPQKALTRKDFRYKRDWKYYKENEQEDLDLIDEFMEEDEDENLYTAGIMLVVGALMTFLKMLDIGGSAIGNPLDGMDVVVKYAFGFLTVAGINAIGSQMATAKGNKKQLISDILKALSIFAFATLVFCIVSTSI